MNQLPSLAAFYEHMDRARQAGPLLTNLYPTPERVQRWIDEGALFSMTVGDVLFILRRDRDFLHVSYVASSAADLVTAVQELVASSRETLTVDVLGKREQVDDLAELFVKAGFVRHRVLNRMTKVSDGSSPPAADDPEVELAQRDDGAALARMLESELDRYTEQIPDADEMGRAASEHKILIIRAGAEIAGLLFFEATGQSSLLRHWVVDSAHRDRRVGTRLMRRYFSTCKDVRRFTLWVISDNDNAIDRYRHYGYQNDVLIDQVLLRRAS